MTKKNPKNSFYVAISDGPSLQELADSFAGKTLESVAFTVAFKDEPAVGQFHGEKKVCRWYVNKLNRQDMPTNVVRLDAKAVHGKGRLVVRYNYETRIGWGLQF